MFTLSVTVQIITVKCWLKEIYSCANQPENALKCVKCEM